MRLGFKQQMASEQRSRAFMVGLGLVGIAIFFTFAYIGFTAPNAIPGRSYYYLYVRSHNADNITPRNQVRVDGEIVGQVLDPKVEHGIALLKLQLAPSIAPLRSDTTMQVLPRSAVGVRYINLTPGLRGRKLPSGSILPASQASATEPLDTLLSSFDPATRHDTQLFMRSFGEGLAGQGENLNAALGGAPAMLANSGAGSAPAAGAAAMLRSSAGTFQAIADHPGSVRSLIRGSATLATASAPVRQQIATGFHPEALALQPFTDRAAIRGTLGQAPPTLSTVQSRLPAFDLLATQLTGFARGILPGLQAGPRAFGETSALLTEARPALIQARTVLATVGGAVDPTLSLLYATSPVLAPLRTGLDLSDPITGVLGQHGCDFYGFGRNWTSMMQYGNSAGNVLRFDVSAAVPYPLSHKTQAADPYPPPCSAQKNGSGL